MSQKHLIAYLETLPEDTISKLLSMAYCHAKSLDDKTPFEQNVQDTIVNCIVKLEKPVIFL